MSRSYKKPWVKVKDTTGYWKNHYNRCLRRKPQSDLPNGKHYRKHGDQWNCCDYRWLSKSPLASAANNYYLRWVWFSYEDCGRWFRENLKAHRKAFRK